VDVIELKRDEVEVDWVPIGPYRFDRAAYDAALAAP
jgi:hypothetical protein